MNQLNFLATFRQKIGTLVLFGALVAAVSFFLLMVLEKRFQSSMDFLVVQTTTTNQDFYTQFKSSEYLGKILAEAVYSERFIDAVIQTGKVNAEFLPFDKKERLEAWQHMIRVQKNLELGIIGIRVKSDSEREATRVMQGMAEVLTQKNMLFRGGDEKAVEIRVLSGPISEHNTTPSKIALVIGMGFFAGFLLSALVVFLRAETKRRDELEFRSQEFSEVPA